MIYLPVYQAESVATANAVFLIRTKGNAPEALAAAARNVIRSADAGLIVSQGSTMDKVVSTSTATRRMLTATLAGFAAAALLLAITGLYGLLSYHVTQRTGEIAVRMALGARQSGVVFQVVLHGLQVTAAGVIAGVLACLRLGTLLSAFLWGVEPSDLSAPGLAGALLLATAALAAYVPARRAAAVDPIAALRE